LEDGQMKMMPVMSSPTTAMTARAFRIGLSSSDLFDAIGAPGGR